MKQKSIGIGLIGLGCVGIGVLTIFRESFLKIHNASSEYKLELIKVCARTLNGKKEKLEALGFNEVALTDNYHEVIEDERINIVIELVGGVKEAKVIAEQTLTNHKHLVVANKALLSEHIEYLTKLAEQNNVFIHYEAAVAGGIPILKLLQENFLFTKINTIYSIINGTSNYILSKMTLDGTDFESALQEAQKLGFAETDPTFDIDGTDIAQKLIIITYLIFNKHIPFNQLYRQGIKNIKSIDLVLSKALGYRIKMLGILKINERQIDVRTHLALVKSTSQFAHTENEYNSILIKSSHLTESLYYGQGAGSLPTAFSVVNDIKNVVQKMSQSTPNSINALRHNNINHRSSNVQDDFTIVSPKNIKTDYYLRCSLPGKADDSNEIVHTLTTNNMVIKKSLTSPSSAQASLTHFACLIETTTEDKLLNAIAEVAKKYPLTEPPLFYRVEI